MKKKLFLHTICAFFILSGFQNCKKYANGPAFSLRTRAERVANTWKVENYKINRNDFTSLVSNYTETFSKKGNYSYSWGIFNESGSWSFQNKDKEIKLTGPDNQTSRVLIILKLEEKSFWYYYIDGNDKNELHLISD